MQLGKGFISHSDHHERVLVFIFFIFFNCPRCGTNFLLHHLHREPREEEKNNK